MLENGLGAGAENARFPFIFLLALDHTPRVRSCEHAILVGGTAR